MRRLSLTLLAAGAVLVGAAPHAHAQFFNLTTDFQTQAGVHVVNAFSTDTGSALGINDIVMTGVSQSTATVPLYTFATNSNVTNPTGGGTAGTFNFPYRVAVTIVPSNAAGTPLAGYSAITQFVTGTITGQLDRVSNTLVNTYDNVVSTPSGQAEVFNYVFNAAGMPTVGFQLRALQGAAGGFLGPGFYNGGSPAPKAGSATAAIASTPEPGTLALLFGMGMSGAMVARRRMRRK
jgi:hypothetical protein